jgi:hypothetical protein
MLFCACLILPLFMIDFVRLTHRIAGPLVRFRIALVQIMQGHRVNEVELRKGDLLTEFQQSFNEFLSFYNRQLDGQPQPPPRMTAEQAELVTSVTSSADDDAQPIEAAAAH